MGGVDISLPNISYCEDVKDVNYTPYNTVEFYVGEITTPHTVSIYTDKTNHVDVQVSEGNKWYSYVLPKDKGLFKIEGSSAKKMVIKADISFEASVTYPYFGIIPTSTVEASFKGSKFSKVTSMNQMFIYCSGLTSLDVSSFDTSNVTDMSDMFLTCRSLKSLDLSGWNTSKVTNMSKMFSSCGGLISLDLSNFDTSNVTDMSDMFNRCTSLTSLDLSNFNTSKVTDMNNMFSNCSKLTSLDLSKWDTSNVDNMNHMFEGCSNSLKIIMKGCSEATIGNIRTQLTTDGITGATITTE